MKELIPTFICVFGTISGVIIAFLILLFEASKGWISISRKKLLYELDDCINKCEHENKLYFKNLIENDLIHMLNICIKDNVINKDNVETLILTIENFISQNLKEELIEIPKFVVIENLCKHLEEYHLCYIKNNYKNYNDSFSFYESFDIIIKCGIGVPLLFATFLTFYYFFDFLILKYFSILVFNIIVLNTALLGFIYVYFYVVYIFKKIKEIDQLK
jgi:hypothetical protein